MDNILKDYGWCQVIKRDEQYILRFDSGGVAVRMTEYQISKKEADKALMNQVEAERVIVEIQKRQGLSN